MSGLKKENIKLHIEHLNSLISGAFYSIKRKRGISLFLSFIATFSSLFILQILLETLFYLPSYFKIGYGIVSLAVSGIVTSLISSKTVTGTFGDFYNYFSRYTNRESIRNALDIYLHKSEKTSFDQLAIKQNLDYLNIHEIEPHLRKFQRNHRIHKLFVLCLSTLLLDFIILTGFTFWKSPAVQRSYHYWISYTRPNPFQYHLTPADSVIEQGSHFVSTIRFSGNNIPRKVLLVVKTDRESSFRKQKLQSVNDSSFISDAIIPVSNLEYYVEMDGYKTPVHHINVQLKPRFENLTVQIFPPAYTKLDSSVYHYPFSQMNAYPGSEVTIFGITNKPVNELSIYHSLKNDISHPKFVQINSRDSIHTSFISGLTDTISFTLTDKFGLHNDNPFTFILKTEKDQFPSVQILKPEPEISILNPDSVSIQYELSDDFGFHSVSLYYELSKAYVKKKTKGQIRLPVPNSLKADETYNWKLEKLDLKPLDQLSYWIEVRDNDSVAGYQKSRSQQHVIRLATLAESLVSNDQQQDSLSQSFQDLRDQNEQLQQEFQQFQDQLRQNPHDTYKNTKKLDEISQRQEALNKKVDEVQKKYARFENKLKKDRVVSKETLEKYQQLKKLIDEIKDPALKKALEELKKSLNNVGQNQIQKALENYKFNESVYKQRLQRTIDLFQNLKLNASLDQLAKLFDNLKQRENEVRTGNTSSGEKAKEQQNISKDLDQANEHVGKLKKESPERLQRLVNQLHKDLEPKVQQTQKQLKGNIEKLNQPGQEQKTKAQQQEIEKHLGQIAQNIRDAKITMNQQQASINLLALKGILQDLILLSDSQEKITTNVGNLPDRSSEFRDEARRQKNILQSFKQVADSLTKVSSEIPALSDNINVRKVDVQNKMSKSVSYLADRNKNESAAETRYALGGLNNLSSMIASLIDQLANQQSNSGSGSGMSMSQMIKQLQKLSGQQKQLNDQIQQLINDLQGNRLSEDQLKRFNQMARTQNSIRKQLRELQENGGLEPGDKTLSDLQRLQEQMEKSINDLRGGSDDKPFIQRQQNILSRMLSSEKALQERGLSKKRQSETAKQTTKTPPPETTIEELQKILRKQLNGQNQTQYSEYYQQLIQKYFELLQQNEASKKGN